MITKARQLDPELWEKVDEIAKIIDPSAFVDWSTVGGTFDREKLEIRTKYYQSIAQHKAYQILQRLGIAPEQYNWVRLFEAMEEE